jgi:hypothetical protein
MSKQRLATSLWALLRRWLPIIPAWWVGALIAVLVVFVLLGVIRLWRRRRRAQWQRQRHLCLDVSQLDATGPPPASPRLEFYGTPVRLAVVVIAPAGRHSDLPPVEMLPSLLDRLEPGMARVIASHQPLVRTWPTQLSSQGFAQAFFNQVLLPGDRGKGTPWCSIAGKFQVGERLLLVGFVCCAREPNGLSQITVQHEGQWLDILRIRGE